MAQNSLQLLFLSSSVQTSDAEDLLRTGSPASQTHAGVHLSEALLPERQTSHKHIRVLWGAQSDQVAALTIKVSAETQESLCTENEFCDSRFLFLVELLGGQPASCDLFICAGDEPCFSFIKRNIYIGEFSSYLALLQNNIIQMCLFHLQTSQIEPLRLV